jgi:hypothetical protein
MHMPDVTSLSDDELFGMIGEELAAGEVGAVMPPYHVLVKKGREWMVSNKKQLCDKLCPSTTIRGLIQADSFGKDALIIMADIVSHEVIGVPAVAVSLLFIRLGYHKLCSSYDIYSPD